MKERQRHSEQVGGSDKGDRLIPRRDQESKRSHRGEGGREAGAEDLAQRRVELAARSGPLPADRDKPARIVDDLADQRQSARRRRSGSGPPPPIRARRCAARGRAAAGCRRRSSRCRCMSRPVRRRRQGEAEAHRAEALDEPPALRAELAREAMAAEIARPALDARPLGEGDVERIGARRREAHRCAPSAGRGGRGRARPAPRPPRRHRRQTSWMAPDHRRQPVEGAAHHPRVERRRQHALVDLVAQRRGRRRPARTASSVSSAAAIAGAGRWPAGEDVLGKQRRGQRRDFRARRRAPRRGSSAAPAAAPPRRPVRVTVIAERSPPSPAVSRWSGSSQPARRRSSDSASPSGPASSPATDASIWKPSSLPARKVDARAGRAASRAADRDRARRRARPGGRASAGAAPSTKSLAPHLLPATALAPAPAAPEPHRPADIGEDRRRRPRRRRSPRFGGAERDVDADRPGPGPRRACARPRRSAPARSRRRRSTATPAARAAPSSAPMPVDEIARVGEVEIGDAGGDAGPRHAIVAALERPGRVDHQIRPLRARAPARHRPAGPWRAAAALARPAQKRAAFSALRPATSTWWPAAASRRAQPRAEAAIAADDEDQAHSNRSVKLGPRQPAGRRRRPNRPIAVARDPAIERIAQRGGDDPGERRQRARASRGRSRSPAPRRCRAARGRRRRGSGVSGSAGSMPKRPVERRAGLALHRGEAECAPPVVLQDEARVGRAERRRARRTGRSEVGPPPLIDRARANIAVCRISSPSQRVDRGSARRRRGRDCSRYG